MSAGVCLPSASTRWETWSRFLLGPLAKGLVGAEEMGFSFKVIVSLLCVKALSPLWGLRDALAHGQQSVAKAWVG